jgi:hypothetical protein
MGSRRRHYSNELLIAFDLGSIQRDEGLVPKDQAEFKEGSINKVNLLTVHLVAQDPNRCHRIIVSC